MEIQFHAKIVFKNIITNMEEENIHNFLMIQSARSLPEKGSIVTLAVGDGTGTIFGKGKCNFRFKVEHSQYDNDKVGYVRLAKETFSTAYKREFLYNWRSLGKSEV